MAVSRSARALLESAGSTRNRSPGKRRILQQQQQQQQQQQKDHSDGIRSRSNSKVQTNDGIIKSQQRSLVSKSQDGNRVRNRKPSPARLDNRSLAQPNHHQQQQQQQQQQQHPWVDHRGRKKVEPRGSTNTPWALERWQDGGTNSTVVDQEKDESRDEMMMNGQQQSVTGNSLNSVKTTSGCPSCDFGSADGTNNMSRSDGGTTPKTPFVLLGLGAFMDAIYSFKFLEGGLSNLDYFCCPSKSHNLHEEGKPKTIVERATSTSEKLIILQEESPPTKRVTFSGKDSNIPTREDEIQEKEGKTMRCFSEHRSRWRTASRSKSPFTVRSKSRIRSCSPNKTLGAPQNPSALKARTKYS